MMDAITIQIFLWWGGGWRWENIAFHYYGDYSYQEEEDNIAFDDYFDCNYDEEGDQWS